MDKTFTNVYANKLRHMDLTLKPLPASEYTLCTLSSLLPRAISLSHKAAEGLARHQGQYHEDMQYLLSLGLITQRSDITKLPNEPWSRYIPCKMAAAPCIPRRAFPVSLRCQPPFPALFQFRGVVS